MRYPTSARSRRHRRSLFVEPLEKRLLLDAAGVGVTDAQDNLERVIVMLHDEVEHSRAAAQTLVDSHRGQLSGVYESIFKGFAGRFPANRLEALRSDSNVKLVEPDLLLQPVSQTIPTGVDRIDADLNHTANIDGINQLMDVTVGVLDTGVQGDHPDLNVNNSKSADCTKGRNGCKVGDANDGNGHGTHVAGTIGALDNDFGVVGVAPGAEIWSIKVCGNAGCSLSDILEGHDYVSANAGEVDVINLSLGGTGWSASWRAAIQDNVSKGVVVVVAAGNSSTDIYGGDGTIGNGNETIPAAFPEAAAISALADSDGKSGGTGPGTNYGPDDTLATFSNYSTSVVADNPVTSSGAAIDWAAPGVDILSTYKGSSYATISGTSMASPHGAGAVALYIAENGRATDALGVAAIRQALIDGAQPMAEWGGVNTDPDSNHEGMVDVGQSQLDHDVAVTALSAPDSVVDGETVTVEVTVENQGTNAETFDVVLRDGADTIEMWTDVTLGASESTSLSFSWTEASLGVHTLEAEAVLQTNTDQDLENNTKSTTVTVEAAVTDVAITAVDAPTSVVQGTSATVSVTVANIGNQSVSTGIVVSLASPEGATSPDQTIIDGLEAGQSTTLEFTWDTTGASLGDHILTASHTLADDDETNNSKSTTVEVTEEPTTATTSSVESITYTTDGGKNSDKHLTDTVAIVDNLGNPVSDASVSIQLNNTSTGQVWVGTATTGAEGKVSFDLKNAPDGCYVTTVTAVTAEGLDFDGTTPTNEHCKGGSNQAGRGLFSVATSHATNQESHLADPQAQSIHEELALPFETPGLLDRPFAQLSLNHSMTEARGTFQDERTDGGDVDLLLLTENSQRNEQSEESTWLTRRNHQRLDLGPILEQLADEAILDDLDADMLDELSSGV